MGKPESKNLLIICGFRQILALTAAGALSPDVTNRLSRRTPGEPTSLKHRWRTEHSAGYSAPSATA